MSNIYVEGLRQEYVEIEVDFSRILGKIEQLLYSHYGITVSDIYKDSKGNLKYIEEYHTSHYSSDTKLFEGTEEQKEAVKAWLLVKKAVEKQVDA